MYRRARKSVILQTMGQQLIRRHSDAATLQRPLISQLTTQEQPFSGDGSSEESSSGVSSSGVSFSSDCSSPGSQVMATPAETESVPPSRVLHRRSLPMDYRLLAGMRTMQKMPVPVHSSESGKRKVTSENPSSPAENAVKTLKIIDDSCESPCKTSPMSAKLYNKDMEASLTWATNECEKSPLLPSASNCCENESAVVGNRLVQASDVPITAADYCNTVSVEGCITDGGHCAKENRPIDSQKNSTEACSSINCRCADTNGEELVRYLTPDSEDLGSMMDCQSSDSISDIVPDHPDPVPSFTDCKLRDKSSCFLSDKPQDGGNCSSSGNSERDKLNCPPVTEPALLSTKLPVNDLQTETELLSSTSFTTDNLQLCNEHLEDGTVIEQTETCGLSDELYVSQYLDTERLLTTPKMADYSQSEDMLVKSDSGFCLQNSQVLPSKTVNCHSLESVGESQTISPREPLGLLPRCNGESRVSCSVPVTISQSSTGADLLLANLVESRNSDFKMRSEMQPATMQQDAIDVGCNLADARLSDGSCVVQANAKLKSLSNCNLLANATVSDSALPDYPICCPENLCGTKRFAVSNTVEKTALLVTQPATGAVESVEAAPSATGFTYADTEYSRQDSCWTINRSDSPDIDIVDDVTFHSFSSKRSLQRFVRSNARSRSSDGVRNALGPVERRCLNNTVHYWRKHRHVWPSQHGVTFTSSRRLHEQLQLGLIRPITAQQLKLKANDSHSSVVAPKIRRSALSSNLKNYRLQQKKERLRVVLKNEPSKITVQQRALPECRVVVNKPPLLCSPSSENTSKIRTRCRREPKGLRLLKLTLSLVTQSLEALREPRFVSSVPCTEPGCQFGCICRLFANDTFSQLVGSSAEPSDVSISNRQLHEIGYAGRLSLSTLNKPVCSSSLSNIRRSTSSVPTDIQCKIPSSDLSRKKSIGSASRLQNKASVDRTFKSVGRRKRKQSVREASEMETDPGWLRSDVRTKSVVNCLEQAATDQSLGRKFATLTPTLQQSDDKEMPNPTPATFNKNRHLSPEKTINSAQPSDDDCMIIDNPEPTTICRTPTRRKSIKELIVQRKIKTVNADATSVSTRSSPRKFASLFNDNGWKSRSVQRRGHGLVFRNIRPTLRVGNLTPVKAAASAASSARQSSVISSRSTKSSATNNLNLTTNTGSFLSGSSPVKVRTSPPKVKSPPFRTQMVLFQHSSRNLSPANDGVVKRKGRPCLLEITSNCEWEKVRTKILTQLAGVTIDSTSYPKTCRLLVEGFCVEILPQTDHPTALPDHLHGAVGCQEMIPIRIRITVEAKSPTVLTTTRISVLQQGRFVPVVGQSSVRDLLLSNNGINSLVSNNKGRSLLNPVRQLLQDSCYRLKACGAVSSDTDATACVPVRPAAVSESDANMQRDHDDVAKDAAVCDKHDGNSCHEQHSSAPLSSESSDNLLHLT